jgi:hypothetical protein
MGRGNAWLLPLVALLLTSCSRFVSDYATWDRFSRSRGYAAPRRLMLVVARSDTVRAQDDGGFVDTTALVVQSDLRESGIEAELVDARVRLEPAPRVELSFLNWGEGDKSARMLSLGIAGHAGIVVDVKAISAENRIMLEGRVRGEQADYAGSSRDAAEAAGHSIAKVIADSSYTPGSMQRKGHPPP